jgi:hypothetical protein
MDLEKTEQDTGRKARSCVQSRQIGRWQRLTAARSTICVGIRLPALIFLLTS